MDIKQWDNLWQRIDRVIDLADKWINIYAYTHSPDAHAQAQINHDAKGYDTAPNKGFGLKDRKSDEIKNGVMR